MPCGRPFPLLLAAVRPVMPCGRPFPQLLLVTAHRLRASIRRWLLGPLPLLALQLLLFLIFCFSLRRRRRRWWWWWWWWWWWSVGGRGGGYRRDAGARGSVRLVQCSHIWEQDVSPLPFLQDTGNVVSRFANCSLPTANYQLPPTAANCGQLPLYRTAGLVCSDGVPRGGASPRLCTIIVFWHARCLGLVPFCFPRVTPGLSLVRRAPGPPAGLGSFLSTELRVSHLRNASSSGIDPGRDPGLQFEKICCIS